MRAVAIALLLLSSIHAQAQEVPDVAAADAQLRERIAANVGSHTLTAEALAFLPTFRTRLDEMIAWARNPPSLPNGYQPPASTDMIESMQRCARTADLFEQTLHPEDGTVASAGAFTLAMHNCSRWDDRPHPQGPPTLNGEPGWAALWEMRNMVGQQVGWHGPRSRHNPTQTGLPTKAFQRLVAAKLAGAPLPDFIAEAAEQERAAAEEARQVAEAAAGLPALPAPPFAKNRAELAAFHQHLEALLEGRDQRDRLRRMCLEPLGGSLDNPPTAHNHLTLCRVMVSMDPDLRTTGEPFVARLTAWLQAAG